MPKFLTNANAPFGMQTKRFAPIGYHPGLDPTGSMRASEMKVSPNDYYPKPVQCTYKKYRVESLWKRKTDCEEFSANLGFKNRVVLEQRRYYKSLGGPGTNDVSEEFYKKKSCSVLHDVNFGHAKKFLDITNNNPGPATYDKDIIKASCVNKKERNNAPPTFEWDGFIDRFKPTHKSWSQPPNIYNPVDYGSIEALLKKLVSKKGPYNLFTGPRDETTIKNHFASPKRCTPDKYYSWPNGLDYLLHHPSKRRCGAFLKDLRFKRKPTVRMLMDDLTTCYRDPKEPGPATYHVLADSIKKEKETMYPFNDSDPIARKGTKWTIQPGPGRYRSDIVLCKKPKKLSWVFKSRTGRTDYKPIQYSVFEQ